MLISVERVFEHVEFFIDGQYLGAYCFVKSLDAQNFGLNVWILKNFFFLDRFRTWILTSVLVSDFAFTSKKDEE
ncbi:unnamed protein product [Rhizophagus irregularis]|nr:unnamed protein product [Rhizophagus irregularis]